MRESPATTTVDRPSPSSSVAADDASPARLRVGRIAGAHGLHGGLRVRPDNPESDTLEQVRRAFIEPEQGPTREYKLTSAQRLNRTTIRVTLEGLDDPITEWMPDELDQFRFPRYQIHIELVHGDAIP